MTLRQIRVLGVQVDMVHLLIRHREQFNEAVPYTSFAPYDSSLHEGALKKLMSLGLVRRGRIKNFGGKGTRPGYEVTEAGRAWFPEAKMQYQSLLNSSTHR